MIIASSFLLLEQESFLIMPSWARVVFTIFVEQARWSLFTKSNCQSHARSTLADESMDVCESSGGKTNVSRIEPAAFSIDQHSLGVEWKAAKLLGCFFVLINVDLFEQVIECAGSNWASLLRIYDSFVDILWFVERIDLGCLWLDQFMILIDVKAGIGDLRTSILLTNACLLRAYYSNGRRQLFLVELFCIKSISSAVLAFSIIRSYTHYRAYLCKEKFYGNLPPSRFDPFTFSSLVHYVTTIVPWWQMWKPWDKERFIVCVPNRRNECLFIWWIIVVWVCWVTLERQTNKEWRRQQLIRKQNGH